VPERGANTPLISSSTVIAAPYEHHRAADHGAARAADIMPRTPPGDHWISGHAGILAAQPAARNPIPARIPSPGSALPTGRAPHPWRPAPGLSFGNVLP